MGKGKNGDVQIERQRALAFNHICKSFLKAKINKNNGKISINIHFGAVFRGHFYLFINDICPSCGW